MKVSTHPPLAGRRSWLLIWLAFLGLAAGDAGAQGFRLGQVRREPGGTVAVELATRTNAYYLLQRGTQLPALETVVAAALGTGRSGTLVDAAPPSSAAYYRVTEVPRLRPRDTDRDGIDDAYELQTAGLDPLDPADAGTLAPGAGGRTHLEVYTVDRSPLSTLEETSPFAGEDGVAVTREVVLRFTRPLAPNAVLTVSNLYATFGGRRVLGRVETAADRRSVTLFPLENLPANARVRVTFDPGDARDDLGRRLDPAGSGQPGSVAYLDFDTLSITPVGETAVLGHVFASDPVPDGRGGVTNRPLENVTITVDGAEETLRTTTAADGSFRLQPVPAGRFFVHIDGRTATASRWPDGAYYPVVGKSWEALPGVTTNLANGTGLIYLPLIPADALQPVSAIAETVIAFPPSVVAANPAFAGVEIRVPPNALFDNSGQRGGRVGLAPVASDRLPEPLPPGLDHLLDITVQSDGPENFDQPIPVTFPNLPNPRTGERLAPGEKTALVSFNHDVGRWEVAGSMTVSADGQHLESDPGVGVRRPGWHGWQALTWPTLIPPIIYANPWWVATPPPPTGPLPPPTPQPPEPVPPQPLPDDVGPPPTPTPDDGPDDDWPPFPPWPGDDGAGPPPDGPPTSSPDLPDDLYDFGGDLDDYLNSSSGGGGGGAGSNGGVSAGPFCLHAAIEEGCENDGTLVPARETVGLTEDGGGTFGLRFSEVRGSVGAEVFALSSGRVVFATAVQSPRPPNSLGFGPAAQAFVHHFRQSNASGLGGEEVLQLVTLRDHTQTFAPAKTITVGGAFLNASAVRFSPHGRYLVYTALQTDAHIALLVVDVTTRQTVLQARFPYSTSPVLVQPGDMVQFGPDCADRTMVFHFGDSPTSLAWHLFNLESRRELARRRIAPGGFSSWEFTRCGDAVLLSGGPVVDPVIFATLDGRVLADLPAPAPARADSAPTPAPRRSLHRSLHASPEDAFDPTTWPRPLYSRGLHYWLLVDMLTGEVVQRGRTGASGGLMEGVLLAPRRPFRLYALRAADFLVGRADFVSGNVGGSFRPPFVNLTADASGDRDADGLPDLAEYIAGASPVRPDTNGDGVNDAAAVRAGLDPAAGTLLATGIVGAVPLPGSAVDLCAVGDQVVVALGAAGIAVLQHPPGRNPIVTALVDTPGDARRIACSGNLVAVADGPTGLQILDISDPPAARIRTYLPGIGQATCVATAEGIAYVGTQGGTIVQVELASGTELGRTRVDGPIQDLQFGGDRLYVLSNRRLMPFRLELTDVIASGPPVLSGSPDLAERLFVGGGYAYLTHFDGYRVFDLSDPDRPVERTRSSDTQIGWYHLVANGSGLGLAAAGPQVNLRQQVQLYDLSDPARNDQFLTRFPMPAAAAGVAIHAGLGYVATTTAGLQVLNYRTADTGTNPPTIRLAATFPLAPAQVESGQFAAIEAITSDDVQVREVEFYRDGERVAIDGGFPFEYRFFAPSRTDEQTTLRLRARAIDTAGNAAWSEEQIVELLADRTPPRARPVAPTANGFAVSPARIGVVFNEPIDATTLSGRLQLAFLGADRRPDTPDDRAIAGTVRFEPELRSAELRFAVLEQPGRYQAILRAGVADVAGNAMTQDLVWAFEVVVGTDSDGDGLTDAFETAGGLDPLRADENANGLPDALDDFDNDGLSNGEEMLIGTNPRQARTFDGIPDRERDRDGDWIPDIRELALGTDPGQWDSDGDGWNDEVEITTGSPPLVPNAYLPGLRMSGTAAQVLQLVGHQFRAADAHLLHLSDRGAIHATAQAHALRLGGPNALGHSIVAAEPPVRVRLFAPDADDLAPNELPRRGAFVIEAEDFNHGAGQHVPAASQMPYPGGAYAGLAGVVEVDFFNQDSLAAQLYRAQSPPHQVALVPNVAGRFGVERPGWLAFVNHRLDAPAVGDWQHYTRRIPTGNYWVWAALSSGGWAAAEIDAELSRVTGTPSQPGAARVSLGRFEASGSGGLGQNRLVLLRDPGGTPAVVMIEAAETTFRVDLRRGSFDWMVLIPIDSAP